MTHSRLVILLWHCGKSVDNNKYPDACTKQAEQKHFPSMLID